MVQKTLIDGQVYFDRQRDIDMRPALEKEKQDLLAKEKSAAEEKKAEGKAEGKPEKKPDAKKKQPPTGQSNAGGVAGGGL